MVELFVSEMVAAMTPSTPRIATCIGGCVRTDEPPRFAAVLDGVVIATEETSNPWRIQEFERTLVVR